MSEITKDDLRELRDSISRRFDTLDEKIDEHIKDDQDVAKQVAVIDNKVTSLSGGSRMMVQWVLGLVAIALASAVGFLVRNAIDVQVARPVQQQFVAPPPQQAHP